jgi:hypothetical protein
MDVFPGLPQRAMLQLKLQFTGPKNGSVGRGLGASPPKNRAQIARSIREAGKAYLHNVRSSFQGMNLVVLVARTVSTRMPVFGATARILRHASTSLYPAC